MDSQPKCNLNALDRPPQAIAQRAIRIYTMYSLANMIRDQRRQGDPLGYDTSNREAQAKNLCMQAQHLFSPNFLRVLRGHDHDQ